MPFSNRGHHSEIQNSANPGNIKRQIVIGYENANQNGKTKNSGKPCPKCGRRYPNSRSEIAQKWSDTIVYHSGL
jgi:hypothetical protein